jgi:hypothetical protein
MFYKYVCAKSIVHISRYILCVQTKEHTHTEETPELQLNPPNYTRGLYIFPCLGHASMIYLVTTIGRASFCLVLCSRG